MRKIEYSETDQRGLDSVEPLWLKLNKHHKSRSRHFKNYFKNYTFETRKQGLLEKSHQGTMHIGLATDANTGKLVGYCISTISGSHGEVDSIYIEKEYRYSGIGSNLIKKAIAWMDKMSVSKRIVAVAAGNEEAFGFYARYNFYPQMNILEQIQ